MEQNQRKEYRLRGGNCQSLEFCQDKPTPARAPHADACNYTKDPLLCCWRVWAGGFMKRGRATQNCPGGKRGAPHAHITTASANSTKGVFCKPPRQTGTLDARSACPTDWGAVSCERITLRQRARGRGWARRAASSLAGELFPARTVTAQRSARGSAVGQNCPPARTVTAQSSPPQSPNACQGSPGHDRRACGQAVQKILAKFRKSLDFPLFLCYTVAVRWHSESYPAQPSCPRAPSLRVSGKLRVAV
jgi:hypothetical protein